METQQLSPEEQEEQRRCAEVEAQLTEQYGKVRDHLTHGLRWLTGTFFIPLILIILSIVSKMGSGPSLGLLIA